MFPVRDHNPSRRTPYVTYALLALNILIFLSYWGVMQDPARINPIFWNWAMIPAQITAGDNYISLVTSTFLHGGFMHLAGNMLFLWIFGDNLEDELGHVGFLIFYLFCGILYLLPIWLRRGGRQWWDRTEGHPPHPDATYSPSTIPIIPRRK